MNGLRLFARYAATSFRSQAQYPASTAMLTLGQLAVTLIELGAAWALFHRFGEVKGWRFGEIALFYGLVNVQYAVVDLLTRGFDALGAELIRGGGFDRLLLRPRTLTLQLMGHDVRLARIGRLATGLIAVALATRLAPIEWSPASVAMALWTIAGGVALFFGILVFQGTLSFWTIESLEIANAFSYGGVEAAQYPLALYERWFRAFLTFVVPIACIAYFPVLRILDRADPLGTPAWLGVVSPAAGPAFLALSFLAWRAGVRRHESTGS